MSKNQKPNLFNEKVEEAANNAQAASGQNNGVSPMLALMRALAGGHRQARNNSEALGMGVGRYIMPGIVNAISSGIDDGVANKNTRGYIKSMGDDLARRVNAGEELSPWEQKRWDMIKERYPDRYAELLKNAQATAQQASQGSFNSDVIRGAIQGEANMPTPYFLGDPKNMPPTDYSNDALWAQSNPFSNQLMDDIKNSNLLDKIYYGR